MRRAAWVAGLALLTSCAHRGAGASGAAAQGPTERPACASCHVAGQPQLKADVLTICRSCHTTAHGTLLASDPGAGMACNSCHDPHAVHGMAAVPRA